MKISGPLRALPVRVSDSFERGGGPDSRRRARLSRTEVECAQVLQRQPQLYPQRLKLESHRGGPAGAFSGGGD